MLYVCSYTNQEANPYKSIFAALHHMSVALSCMQGAVEIFQFISPQTTKLPQYICLEVRVNRNLHS